MAIMLKEHLQTFNYFAEKYFALLKLKTCQCACSDIFRSEIAGPFA